jgi:hypothetical protein
MGQLTRPAGARAEGSDRLARVRLRRQARRPACTSTTTRISRSSSARHSSTLAMRRRTTAPASCTRPRSTRTPPSSRRSRRRRLSRWRVRLRRRRRTLRRSRLGVTATTRSAASGVPRPRRPRRRPASRRPRPRRRARSEAAGRNSRWIRRPDRGCDLRPGRREGSEQDHRGDGIGRLRANRSHVAGSEIAGLCRLKRAVFDTSSVTGYRAGVDDVGMALLVALQGTHHALEAAELMVLRLREQKQVLERLAARSGGVATALGDAPKELLVPTPLLTQRFKRTARELRLVPLNSAQEPSGGHSGDVGPPAEHGYPRLVEATLPALDGADADTHFHGDVLLREPG